MKVVIIDYGMGNLGSIERAIAECGADHVQVSQNPREIEDADRLILPGVGAFADGITNLQKTHLDQVIKTASCENHIPMLGICLGMQLMATRGTEGEIIDGLNLIPGEVKKLCPAQPAERIPHIGWNEVYYKKPDSIFDGIPDKSDFYFVHSYHFVPEQPDDVIGVTPYCGRFVAAIHRDSLWGVQFHPEKSSVLGFRLLKNFLMHRSDSNC